MTDEIGALLASVPDTYTVRRGTRKSGLTHLTVRAKAANPDGGHETFKAEGDDRDLCDALRWWLAQRGIPEPEPDEPFAWQRARGALQHIRPDLSSEELIRHAREQMMTDRERGEREVLFESETVDEPLMRVRGNPKYTQRDGWTPNDLTVEVTAPVSMHQPGTIREKALELFEELRDACEIMNAADAETRSRLAIQKREEEAAAQAAKKS